MDYQPIFVNNPKKVEKSEDCKKKKSNFAIRIKMYHKLKTEENVRNR